ncbi:hypothetical protein JCM16303_002324 [Sporobolomyces ruberrimus]
MTSSRPPRSRSSMFIAPIKTPVASTSNSRPTLLSKIGALRRVSSFSSLSSRTSSSPPATPSTPSSPSLVDDDAYDTLPQDIPRSSSVMSWFSSDEETDSRRPSGWRMPKLRRKNRMSPKNPTFTFTTSASALSSADLTPCSALGAPCDFTFSSSSESRYLPAVHPVELDLALDFDCAFPRPYDSDDSDRAPSPPFTPNFHPLPQYLGSPVILNHPRESVCWYDREDEEEDSRTLYARSSPSETSTSPSSPWSSLRNSSRSPEMTESDEDDNESFEKFANEATEPENDQVDEEVCRQLAAFRILALAPALVATPRTPTLRSTSSTESLLDPHFDSPSTPSPTAHYSPIFSSPDRATSGKTEFAFPLPPSSASRFDESNPKMSFLGLEFEDDDDAPWYDCNP